MPREDNARQLSLRDIADEAGVSVSTVSRVLSNSSTKAKISDDTRQRVLAICEERKFHPNIHYRRLHEGLSRVIAFIIPTPSPQLLFFDENVGSFLGALEPCLAHHGFHIMIQSATPDFVSSRHHLEIFRSQAVDAAILWDVFRDNDPLKEMIQEGRPLLKVGFPSDALEDQIVPDNYQGARDLANHLVELGHRRIAHVSGGYSRIEKEREAGYLSVMDAANLQPLIYHAKFTYQSGYNTAEKIMMEEPEVTAIMASNDVSAAGCLRRLKELGHKVPHDISVTGFDGTSHSAVTEPDITTVDLRLDKIGRLAADRIVNAVVDSESYTPRITRVQMPLITRGSTSAPRKFKSTSKKNDNRKSIAKS